MVTGNSICASCNTFITQVCINIQKHITANRGTGTWGIFAQEVHRKIRASSRICKIRAKDVEQAGKMCGESKTDLQNREKIALMEPEQPCKTNKMLAKSR